MSGILGVCYSPVSQMQADRNSPVSQIPESCYSLVSQIPELYSPVSKVQADHNSPLSRIPGSCNSQCPEYGVVMNLCLLSAYNTPESGHKAERGHFPCVTPQKVCLAAKSEREKNYCEHPGTGRFIFFKSPKFFIYFTIIHVYEQQWPTFIQFILS